MSVCRFVDDAPDISVCNLLCSHLDCVVLKGVYVAALQRCVVLAVNFTLFVDLVFFICVSGFLILSKRLLIFFFSL